MIGFRDKISGNEVNPEPSGDSKQVSVRVRACPYKKGRGPFRRLFSAPATAFAGRIRCYRAERGIGRYFFFAKNRYLSGYVFQVLHRVAVVVAAAGVRSGAGDGAAYRPPPRSASRYDPPESGGPETGLALRQRLSQTQGFVAAQ